MRKDVNYVLLDSVATTGSGKVVDVSEFNVIHLQTETAANGGDATLTLKVKGSISESEPDFDTAAAEDNGWDVIQMKDLEDAASINGDDGYSVTTTNEVRVFAVNVSGLKWLTVDVTAHTQGQITVRFRAYDAI